VLLAYDRRFNWAKTPIGGNYNIRLRDNTVEAASQKTLTELCDLALAEVGEGVGLALPAIYPRADWNGTTVAKALDGLCSVAPVHVVRSADDTYNVAQTIPGDLLESAWSQTPDYLARVDSGPKTITIRCAPTWFMCGLLLEAVGQEADSDYELIDDLSYVPTPDGWEKEWPEYFAGVTQADRALAFESVYRTYRVKVSQDLAFEVEEEALSLTSHDDILLDPYQVLFGTSRQPPALLNGTYWPYSDHYVNVDNCPVTSGTFTVDPELPGVKLTHPLWKVGSSDQDTEPADLKLYTGFHLRDPDTGDWYRESFSIERDTGEGEITIDLDFLWRAWSFTPDGCNNGTGEDNYDDLETEATVYLTAWKNHFDAQRDKRFMQYAGTHALALSGSIAEITYRIGRGLTPKTVASQHFHQSTMRD
jgi:hypothetical protein